MNIIKKLLLTTCLAVCVQLSQGQNTVESIRQRYADAKAYIEQHKGSNNNDGSDWASCRARAATRRMCICTLVKRRSTPSIPRTT